MANCGAIASPTFQPAMREISAITQANPATVTTTFDHDYITGEIVRLYIPLDHGMIRADQLVGEITVTAATTFTINIDTTGFEAFVVPGASLQCPQVVPLGERNSLLLAATDNVLPSGNR